MMPNDILLVMALEEESLGRVEQAGFDVIYTKIGKVNAAYKLTQAIFDRKHKGKETKLVINLGTAGSHLFNRGTLVACHQFVQRDMDGTKLGFDYGKTPYDDTPLVIEHQKLSTDIQQAGICGSGDSFESGKPKITCDVLDMEAYALAKVCKEEAINFGAIKYITDGADNNAASDWQSALNDASYALSEVAKNIKI